MINSILEEFNEVKIFSTCSKDLMQGGIRLDASFYRNKFFSYIFAKTKNVLLEEYCESIFNPPVFKREFQISESGGCRYLASSEIISLVPDQIYISKNQANALNLKVKKGWILITGFGTIGSVRIVDKLIDGFAVANNVTRLILKDAECRSGFIAAYLSSPIGRSLLNGSASGSVVKFIEAPQIAKIPIPIIDDDKLNLINAKYLSAVNCREEAFNLLKEAEKMVYLVNGLVEIQNKGTLTFNDEHEIEFSIINSKEIIQPHDQSSEFRLDSSYYSPFAMLVQENLKSCETTLKRISEVTKKVFFCNRFKRKYVNKEFGIPYIAGKNINQIYIPDMHFISKVETQRMDEYLLKKGWILLTCSGTIGRICFIWNNFEGYFGTHDLIRIIPEESQVDLGYLYAFLACRYGQEQIFKFIHGSVIDHITPEQVQTIEIAVPNIKQQKLIGDKVRFAYEKRAEAIRLEGEAQEILMKELGLNTI